MSYQSCAMRSCTSGRSPALTRGYGARCARTWSAMGKDGSEMVLSYQFAGQSSTGLPPGGEWRCMRVADISDATSRTGQWHTGDNHSRPQMCVKIIDVEVQF